MSIAVVGGGSWGTALAIHAARAGGAVRLWAREREVVEGIRTQRRSPWYLADIDVPSGVEPTNDLDEALHGATLVIIVIPSEFVAATLKTFPSIPADVPILQLSAGLDSTKCVEAYARMREIVTELRDEGPRPEEVERARAYAAGARVLAFENTNAVARHAAQQTILFGDEVDPDLAIAALDAVTLDDVRAVARDVADELAVACVGPHTVDDFA